MSVTAPADRAGDADSVVRLHDLIRQRDTLQTQFRACWTRLATGQDPTVLDDWSSAALALMEANAGASCHLAFWRISAAQPAVLARLALGGVGAATICRRAGAKATLALLEALPAALAATGAGIGLTRWLEGLERLARQAPDCVVPVAAQAQRLLAEPSGVSFTNWIAAGLKAYRRDPRRRSAFFSLEDPWALTLLARRPDIPGFVGLADGLASFSRALWGDVALLRAAPVGEGPRQRASLADAVVLLPDSVAAPDPASARLLYTAMVAHAGAHLAVPRVRYPVGTLKPLQVALVGLVEDARIEALALQQYPGLRRLWTPFHTAPPSGARTAPALLARLARTLLDPGHVDPDGFVAKGRGLFLAEADRGLSDPALSLRIGRLLGHDLGQMRVQFNWRDYQVDAAYRDDGQHLWEPLEQAPARPVPLDPVPEADENPSPDGAGADQAVSARAAVADPRGPVIATYAEWDEAAALDRPDWTTLRDAPMALNDPGPLRAEMTAQAGARLRIARLIRNARLGPPVRLRRQSDGDDLDMDAVLDAATNLRAGLAPDMRLFRRLARHGEAVSTLLMLDCSASTAARLPNGRSILDIQRLAVALLAEAVCKNGNLVSLCAFASDGRDDVRLYRIKPFADPFDGLVLSRLAGLRSALSTRLGTALRHAGAELGTADSARRLLLVLTDGEPSDLDVADPSELVTDASRAAQGLKQSGIDVFGVVLDPQGAGSAKAIFGRNNMIVIRDLADLPGRLAALYGRLSR